MVAILSGRFKANAPTRRSLHKPRSFASLLRRLGRIDDSRPGHVAMVLENHLELMALYGGCAYSGLTLFGVNTSTSCSSARSSGCAGAGLRITSAPLHRARRIAD